MKKLICFVLVISFLCITACVVDNTDDNGSEDMSSHDNTIFSYPVTSKEESYFISSVDTTEGNDETSDIQITEDVVSSDDTSFDVSSVINSEPEISVPPISSPDISIEPSVPGSEWVNDIKYQQDIEYHGFTAEELDNYFDDALFVGDSVANGLKLYTDMYEKIFQGMVFNTGACYGYHNCLSPVSSKSMHPLYQGQKRTIWEMVSLTSPNKVFIGFGLNDFGCTTTASIQKCLDRIIANIRAVKPDVQIIILSSGYFTKSGESYKPNLNDYRTNFRQRDYNHFVLEYCNALGLDYIDVSNCFADEYGYLPKENSLDNYCHPQIKLYTAWRDILYSYAANKTLGTYQNPARMK